MRRIMALVLAVGLLAGCEPTEPCSKPGSIRGRGGQTQDRHVQHCVQPPEGGQPVWR